MDCKYTAFDRIINITKKLPENRVDEAIQIIQEDDGLMNLLAFCKNCMCFSKEQATTLYHFMIRYMNLSSNYHEFDHEKLMKLYNTIGISKNMKKSTQINVKDHIEKFKKDYKYTAFDKTISITKRISKNKINEAIQIIQEDSLIDLLDFCVENGCFTEVQSTIIYDFIIMFEDLDGNYHEFDNEKLIRLYNAIGIPENMQKPI